MKKLLPFLFLIFLCLQGLSAQAWFQPDYRWITRLSGGFAGYNFNFELSFEADTTIHGLPCRKWHTNYNDPHGFTLGPYFTYAVGPRAYCYNEQLDSLVKIYDFSLPVGGQVQFPQQGGGVAAYQIISIDSVQAGNFFLKRQRALYLDANGQPTSWKFDILENIGMVGLPFDMSSSQCAFVFIPNLECSSVVDGFDYSFRCFSSNSGSFHPYSPVCALTETTSPERTGFEVLPNPTSDYFRILVDKQDVQTVAIRDVCGKTLQSWTGAQERYVVSELPAGVYMVCLKMSNGAFGVKKLVRQ